MRVAAYIGTVVCPTGEMVYNGRSSTQLDKYIDLLDPSCQLLIYILYEEGNTDSYPIYRETSNGVFKLCI